MTNRCRLQFRATRVRPGIACTFAAALLVAHHSGVDAQHASGASSPALVVFAEQSGAGADRVPLSAQASATLETIRSDPAAFDIRIGHGNPDAVIAARALSLALPSPTDACTDSGQGALDFTDVEVTYNDEDMVSLYARDEAKDAEVSLVIQGPDVLGSVRCGDDVYKLTPLGDGMTAVYEFDTSQLRQHPPGWREFILDSWTEILQEGEQDEGGQAPVPEAPDPRGTPGAAADTGDVIDILVAYTPAAKVEAGNIDTFIQMAINNTNRIYANSNINLRLRVVDTYEVSYTQDADMTVDLNRLTFTRSDSRGRDPQGYMDEIHERRDRYGADLVALFVDRRRNYCGFAWIPDVPGFPDYDWSMRGFSVTAQRCETLGSYVFAHEIGHNQGGDHNPPHAALSSPFFSYGHGFCNTAGNWRTVMSYADNGDENGNRPCRTRTPYFSSPLNLRQGRPTGDATTHDNRRVLRETQVRVANYRPSKSPQTLTLPLVPPATNLRQQGFVRIINHSNRDGAVEITAIDDNGTSFGPVTLSLAAGAAAHFNSQDLESVNPDKDLSGRLGNGTGDWRLALETDLEIEHLAYIRTADGFVTNMHEVAAETEAGSNRYHVPIFNPGKNRNQESKLRVINPGSSSATVEITGVDDDGRAPRLGTVQLTLRAGSARTLTAYELENGSSKFSGRLGAGTGKWRLSVSADRPIVVMSLLELPQSHLTNLSRGQPGVSVPPPLLNEPDLVVESPSANPTTPSAGQLVLLSATVRNQGGAQAPATRLRFYRSSDATITRTDSALQTASVRALPPSDTVNSSISVNAPSAAGTYYYGACVDSVQRESDTANNCSGAVDVTVPGSGVRIGALAVGWKTGRCRDGYGWGLALNAPDSGTAFASAVSNCQSLGLVRCSGRVWFSRCGALAYGASTTECNALGGWGATKSAAELAALSECQKYYSGCRVSVSDSGTRASYCNRGVGSAPAPAAQSGMISLDSPLDAGHSEATSVPRIR